MGRPPKPSKSASDETGLVTPDPFLVAIGKNVEIARRRLNLTQKELGIQAGVNTVTIVAIENAHTNMGVLVLRKIAFALRVDLVDLIPRSDPQDTSLVEETSSVNAEIDRDRRMAQMERQLAELLRQSSAKKSDRI